LRRVEGCAANVATTTQDRCDFLRHWIERVHARGAAGGRDHRDRTVLEPLDAARLGLPRTQPVLRLSTTRVNHVEVRVLEAGRAADERDLLAVGRPCDVALRSERFDLSRLALRR